MDHTGNKPTSDKEASILQATATVFARCGYHQSKIADIASEAGVAAGTIYLYFSRKEDLLVTLFQRHLGAYLEECRPRLFAAENGLPRLRKLIELHIEFFERDHDLARVFQIHTREINPVIRAGIRPAMRAYFDTIEEVLETGVASGTFDPGLEVRVARSVLFGSLDASVTAWILAEQRYPLTGVVDPLCEMLARALGVKEAASDRR